MGDLSKYSDQDIIDIILAEKEYERRKRGSVL